ncbi:hypothetical protein A3E47_02860 [Candidatus Peribacteria bacterium RIFCSPHIGHO2_12_FULL_54_10]|nr:MAG: hypothetical protein A3E47_02860 [Candidatus Peribacteria bacterium RIFCSPHIGHO2_12_FULL_54_10]
MLRELQAGAAILSLEHSVFLPEQRIFERSVFLPEQRIFEHDVIIFRLLPFWGCLRNDLRRLEGEGRRGVRRWEHCRWRRLLRGLYARGAVVLFRTAKWGISCHRSNEHLRWYDLLFVSWSAANSDTQKIMRVDTAWRWWLPTMGIAGGSVSLSFRLQQRHNRHDIRSVMFHFTCSIFDPLPLPGSREYCFS